MDYWQNIEIPPNDPEIIRINEMEKKLGNLPKSVYKVRELITRHEVCHFKFRHHIEKIKSSILSLKPSFTPEKIGRLLLPKKLAQPISGMEKMSGKSTLPEKVRLGNNTFGQLKSGSMIRSQKKNRKCMMKNSAKK